MFNAIRVAASRAPARVGSSCLASPSPPKHSHYQSFSTSASRAADLSKLVLIGRLSRDPEARVTRNDKEYVTYALSHQQK